MNILIICTANICRSPMAEVLLRDAAEQRGAQVTVSSAGLLTSGRPASDGSVHALAARGLELVDHRSRRLEAEMITCADLVLTMETGHVGEAAVLAPQRFASIYTLREFAQRVDTTGPLGDQSLDTWLAAVGAGRTASGLLSAVGLDIDDPYGGNTDDYMEACAEIAGLTVVVADALWGAPGDPVDDPPLPA